MALPSLVAFASGLLGRPTRSQMVDLGDMSLGGSITPVESIAECLQVAFDTGGKRVCLPMSSAIDIPTIPTELFTKFQTSFYNEPVDAVFKALGGTKYHCIDVLELVFLHNHTALESAVYFG